MKKSLIPIFLLALSLFACSQGGENSQTNGVSIEIVNTSDVLWQYKNGIVQSVSAPVFEIDGKAVPLVWALSPEAESTEIFNGITEKTFSGALKDIPNLTLSLKVRMAPDNPVVRFQYVLSSDGEVMLSKNEGMDNISYFTTPFSAFDEIKEVRLSEYDELIHAYQPAERAIETRDFENELPVAGPIVAAQNKTHSLLLAYEHGSQLPDIYLQYALAKDRSIALKSVKGNYWHKQKVDKDHPFESIWFNIAACKGTIDDLASHFRSHILKYLSPNQTSREPYIFYNTWNFQERNKAWNNNSYLASMNYDRMMKEIDIAHQMGIDVFVLDVGWFQKTGDWQVSLERFPDSLQHIRAKLDNYGMKLGLWFNSKAAVSSRMLQNNKANIVSRDGNLHGPRLVWGTEESYSMCFVSPFWEDYADELIRLSKEVGVTYFKWDAIGQHGCNSPDHSHGDNTASAQERADCYSFLQAKYMGKVINKLCAANPEAIVDFDVTEGERAVGLQFLASGKFFMVNNGPYYLSFDDSEYTPGGGMGSNVFVFPGPARARVCRAVLNYDKWIPSVLLLTHYLPDDPEVSQYFNLGSLILGQNGIWGDLPNISQDGIDLFAEVLGKYKQVKYDITHASPIREGQIGGVPEIHEKINPETGKGAVVMFFSYKSPWTPLDQASFGGTFEYVTQNKVDVKKWHNENVEVTFDEKGRAKIKATFKGPEAKIIMFGVE